MITLTKPAATRIADQIAKNNALALRFGAKESGCSGFSYVMDFAESIVKELACRVSGRTAGDSDSLALPPANRIGL